MQLKLFVLDKLQIKFGNQRKIMRKQICLLFKDEIAESNQNNLFIFKQNKIRPKSVTLNGTLILKAIERESI